jgi:type I restriction enzyme M protein
MSDVVQKLWGFCHTLRHDGIDYGDYIEQITYLLFLKMADERGVELPKSCEWPALRDKSGSELTDHYLDVLRKLGKAGGILGDIYAGAQSRFNNPVNLKRLVNLIDETEWTALGVDVKAAAYEGLLEKAASEGKKRCGTVLHAAHLNPVDRALHATRSAHPSRVDHLRPRLRHRRLSGRGV